MKRFFKPEVFVLVGIWVATFALTYVAQSAALRFCDKKGLGR